MLFGTIVNLMFKRCLIELSNTESVSIKSQENVFTNEDDTDGHEL